jgi:DAHL domain-containing protein
VNRNISLVLGVLLVGSGVWLVDAMQLSPRAAFRERDAPRIDALLAGRVAFEVSVLEARAGLSSSFDPIHRALRSLRDAAAAAETLRARGTAYTPAAVQLELAARALTSEEATLEQLKTDLTLLRLSSQYFPLAADALIRRAEAEVRRPGRGLLSRELATLAALRTDVERYAELPVRESLPRLEHGLSQLQTVRASLDAGAREELDVLSGHTRAILDRRERVDQLTRSLVRSPARVHLEAARAAYAESARSQARRAGALSVLSGALALAGVSLLASVVLRNARGSAPGARGETR